MRRKGRGYTKPCYLRVSREPPVSSTWNLFALKPGHSLGRGRKALGVSLNLGMVNDKAGLTLRTTREAGGTR